MAELTPLPTTIPPSSATPIDTPKLLENCMGNAALVGMLFDKFEKQARENLIQISGHLAAGDASQTAKTSHALKGAAGALSASGVQEVAARIEHAARAGALDTVSAAIAELQREVDRCLAYLPTARTSLTGGAAATAGRVA